MLERNREIENTLIEAFTDWVPWFELPDEPSLGEANCMAGFVGKYWLDSVGDLLDEQDCLTEFGDPYYVNVFAYYLPAFAVEAARKGVNQNSGTPDFIDRLFNNLDPGSPLAHLLHARLDDKQRSALLRWFIWAVSQTEEPIRRYGDYILPFLMALADVD
jgi:hypothetical protein